jgi:heptaprenyl diphosphate synthase
MKPRGLGGFMQAHATPGALLAAGALLFPAFLLQQDLVLRALQIVVVSALNALMGRRVRPAQFLIMAAGIVLFNLVIPTGRVLVAVFGVPLTEGALKSGLFKATAMVGLIVLSQFSLRSDLRLPGWLGGLIARTFHYFELIMSQRPRMDRKDVIGSIDQILIEVQSAGKPHEGGLRAPGRSSLKGILALAVVVCINWAPFAYTLVHPRPFWGA